MARNVTPECRYGHGAMLRSETSGSPTQAKAYMAVRFDGKMQLGDGFVFEVWECQQCSYLEFHDVPAEVLYKMQR